MANVFLIYGWQDALAKRQVEAWHLTHRLGLDTVIGYEPDAMRPGGPHHNPGHHPALLGADVALVLLPRNADDGRKLADEVSVARVRGQPRLVFTAPFGNEDDHRSLLKPDEPVIHFDAVCLKQALLGCECDHERGNEKWQAS